MAKMTAKYSGAVEIARNIHLQIPLNQEDLYIDLSKHGYMWESSEKVWREISNEPADDPTNLLRVRVWAKTEDVEAQSKLIVRTLTGDGYRLVEQSQPYVCRPPKQKESRVYLTFIADGV